MIAILNFKILGYSHLRTDVWKENLWIPSSTRKLKGG